MSRRPASLFSFLKGPTCGLLLATSLSLLPVMTSGQTRAVWQVPRTVDLGARDTAYRSTPLGWAEYSSGKPQYAEIAAYLRDTRAATKTT